MITHGRGFYVANLQAEHAERLLGQLSLAHSLPSGSLVEAEPCALCYGPASTKVTSLGARMSG